MARIQRAVCCLHREEAAGTSCAGKATLAARRTSETRSSSSSHSVSPLLSPDNVSWCQLTKETKSMNSIFAYQETKDDFGLERQYSNNQQSPSH